MMGLSDAENMEPEVASSVPEKELPEISWRLSRTGREQVGSKLRRLRQEQWMPLEEAAKARRMPKGRLNKIERGTYVQFDLIHLKQLCKLYSTSAMAFLAKYLYIWFDDYSRRKKQYHGKSTNRS